MEFGNKLVHTNKANQEQLTKPKLMKEALWESEELFRSAFDYAAIGMASLTLDGRWLKVNRALCEIVGYSEEELLETTWQIVQHPDDLNTDLKYVEQTLAGQRKTYQREQRFFTKMDRKYGFS